MAEFVLDTSGVVHGVANAGIAGDCWWTDLSPFCQGKLEAMFASLHADEQIMGSWLFHHAADRKPGFSDLSPAALALILKDCEAQASVYGDRKPDRTDGGIFWSNRQGWRLPTFPPLCPVLSDEGKVELVSGKDQ